MLPARRGCPGCKLRRLLHLCAHILDLEALLLAREQHVLQHLLWVPIANFEFQPQAHATVLEAAVAHGGNCCVRPRRSQGCKDAVDLPRSACPRAHLHHEPLARRARGALGGARPVLPAPLARQRAHVRAAEAEEVQGHGEVPQLCGVEVDRWPEGLQEESCIRGLQPPERFTNHDDVAALNPLPVCHQLQEVHLAEADVGELPRVLSGELTINNFQIPTDYVVDAKLTLRVLRNVLNARVCEHGEAEAHLFERAAHETRAGSKVQAVDDLLHHLRALALQQGGLALVQLQHGAALGRDGVGVDARLLEHLVQAVAGVEHLREAEDHQGLAVGPVHGVPPADRDLRPVAPGDLLQSRGRLARARGGAHVEVGQLEARGALDAELHLVVFAIVDLLVVTAVLDLNNHAGLLTEDGIEIVQKPGCDDLRRDQCDDSNVLKRIRAVDLIRIGEVKIELQFALLGATCQVLHEAHGTLVAHVEDKCEGQRAFKKELSHVQHPTAVLENNLHECVGDAGPVRAVAADHHDVVARLGRGRHGLGRLRGHGSGFAGALAP
mmetsp:Transcript_993/g.3040  ORF Transcript_993/g.3040 Transcript_993/m.3040 type:complete len:553 (+) Transcript_993:1205-2863(+)